MAERRDYTYYLAGVPFRARGSRHSREETARRAQEKFDRLTDEEKIAVLDKRRAALSDMGIDLERNYAIEGMTGAEKFLVGAGRSFVETGRGIRQIANQIQGDEQELASLQHLEANERELFDQLDSSGIGFEDLGQLAPELVAFIGTGGTSSAARAAVNFGARSAALSASKATVEGENRGINAIIGGVAGAAGGAAARGLLNMFGRGAQMTKGMWDKVASLVGRSGGETAANIARATEQAQLLAASKDKATREIGESALKELRMVMQQMNAIGRESVFRQQLNQMMQKSIQETDGVLTLNVNNFVRGLENMSKGQLTKELGKNIGPRIDSLRTTFRELGKLGDMDPAKANTLLRAIMSDEKAAAAANALTNAIDKGADPAVVNNLRAILTTTVSRSPAVAVNDAAAGTRDLVTEIAAEFDRKNIDFDAGF